MWSKSLGEKAIWLAYYVTKKEERNSEMGKSHNIRHIQKSKRGSRVKGLKGREGKGLFGSVRHVLWCSRRPW